MHRPHPWPTRTACLHWPPCVVTLALATVLTALFALVLQSSPAIAHAVAEGDKGYIQEITGVHFIPFVYLGAKHMITGYDHLLFLAGVIFFLYQPGHILT